MAKSNLWTLLLVIILAFGACTKDGNTIYQIDPDEEKPSTAPLVTVIYGPNGLGDRSYCDLIYKGVEEAANEFSNIISGIVGNKEMMVMIAAFAVALVLVYIIRRSSVDNSWKIAIAVGSIGLIIFTLIGDIVTDTQISIPGVIIGTIIAALLMLVLEFFAFNLDYSRTEKVQFEDDEYYYYVKAVPKVTVATPERKVKKINRAREQR